jgi:large subunit ribosomal protein L9
MANVKLILREDVQGLGQAGDVVDVRPGYARNFLVPEGKAVLASEGRLREVEHLRRQIAEKVAKELADHRALKDRIEKLGEVEVRAKVGEEGKLFGSVTVAQIAELLAGRGVELDRRRIDLPEPIKTAGDHPVTVKLHRDVNATLRLKVVPEE